MKSYNIFFLFILLASMGAGIRYYLSFNSSYLNPTLLANSVGCLLIGVVFCLKQNEILPSFTWVLFTIAFLGALTTFSSYVLDVFKLVMDHNYFSAVKYILLTHLLAMGLCFLGYQVTYKILN